MKQTYNINIAGRPYIIDADAYEMLHDYLETLRHAFSKEDDSTELLDDIEGRISEILTEDLERSGSSIVTIREIRNIIARIGRPEEMIEIEETLTDTPQGEKVEVDVTAGPTPPPVPPGRVNKRLYRDPSDKLLGGVCSGIAAYLNIDPTWVRLAVVVLCFLSFSTVAIVYFILWIVVPEAKTPLERLSMRGEAPTVENIGEAVTSEFSPRPENDRQGVHGFISSLMRVCAVLAKVFLVILCIVFTPVLFALIIAFFACIVALVGIGIAPLDFVTSGLMPGEINSMLIFSIALILVIGIPIFTMVAMIWNNYHKRQSLSRSAGITLAAVWIAAIAAGLITGFYMRSDWTDMFERITEKNNTVVVIDETADAAEDSLDAIEQIQQQAEQAQQQAEKLQEMADSIASRAGA